MLIIPLHRKPSAANWPWVTTLLVLLNVLAYFGWQGREDYWVARAQQRYFELELAQIEAPLFARFHADSEAGSAVDDEDLDEWLAAAQGQEMLFMLIQLDGKFLRALADGGELAAERRVADPQGQWASRRAEVELLLNRAATWGFALRYDRIEVKRLIGSMFLHGSFGHLAGNMLFLCLLGLLVEGALGGPLFALVYLASGIGSGLCSYAWRYGEIGYGLGASGAIAGLMGAYCVLWGMRKVRFFYWFFVVFNYVKAPALVLLPLWLGWEIWQLLTSNAHVAFDAHAGGIVSGALLAVLVRLLGWERRDFLAEESAQVDRRIEAVATLREQLGKMDWFAARRAAEQLQTIDPDSFESRVLIWRAWSTATGAPPEQHAAARAALNAEPRKLEQLVERKRIWTDYLRVSGGKPQLTGEALQALGEWFASAGELTLGLQLLAALRNQPALAESSTRALFRLALQRQERDPSGAAQITAVLEKYWPDALETIKLRQLAQLNQARSG